MNDNQAVKGWLIVAGVVGISVAVDGYFGYPAGFAVFGVAAFLTGIFGK
jgi:hypothetical protein